MIKIVKVLLIKNAKEVNMEASNQPQNNKVNVQKPSGGTQMNNQGMPNQNGPMTGKQMLQQQLIGTRKNISVITEESYPEFGLDIEVIEYQKLLGSTNIHAAQHLWFMNEQNIKCRQIGLFINNNGVKIEAGAMSYFQGPLQASSGLNSVGKVAKQIFTGKATGERVVMPEYKGTGMLVLEPSFKHFITLKLAQGEQIICDKGMFYVASLSCNIQPVFAGSASGTLLGGEGIFQQAITGPGAVILESPVPMCEINRIQLNNDILRVDGNFALMRTAGVSMSVEPVAQGLVNSAMTGEGLVNVFRGTGEVWIAPTIKVYDAINKAGVYGGNIAAVDMNTSTGRAR